MCISNKKYFRKTEPQKIESSDNNQHETREDKQHETREDKEDEIYRRYT